MLPEDEFIQRGFAREQLRCRLAGMTGLEKMLNDEQLDALLQTAKSGGVFPPNLPQHVCEAAKAVAQAHMRNTKGGSRGC